MWEKSIMSPSTTNNSFNPEIIYNYDKENVKFNGIWLK